MTNSWETVLKKLNYLAETRGFKADLARRLGVHPSVVQNYLEGNRTPGIEFIDRFAAAVGIQPWELIKPSSSWPTSPKKLSATEHLEAALVVLRELERQGINLHEPSPITLLGKTTEE